MSKTILVPTDFTKVARVALEHAVKTAEVIGGTVTLLNVVAKPADVDPAQDKLNEEAKIVTESNSAVKVECLVRIGNIFDDIGDTAAEIHAELIFMGTHGATGWQKVTGSYALKVITHSTIPFVVVQEKGIKDTGYDDIVVPLDLHKETKQKLEIVSNMSKYFGSKVHLISAKETDEFLHTQMERNMYFAKQYLGEREIEFTTTVAETKDFDGEILNLAKKVNADLITIMNIGRGYNIFNSNYEQILITNQHNIPVMMVNPKETRVSGGGVFSS